jgi:CheY-like chemotaxis protein
VLEADGGPEALDVLGQARGRVDLLMVDVVMPGCDGVELARKVLEEWPYQRILYMSAHPAEVLVRLRSPRQGSRGVGAPPRHPGRGPAGSVTEVCA